MRAKNGHGLLLMLLLSNLLLLFLSCNRNNDDPYTPSVSKGITTLTRTIVPVPVPASPTVKITDAGNFAKFGYGLWQYGPGLPCQKRLDLMPSGYDYSSVKQASRLLRFFTMTDVHITDEESPAQAIFFASLAGELGISCYSPLMLYSTQMLDATVQTINRLHKSNPFDMGLALGDLANNGQYNELRWFIDVMDGKLITPTSGVQKLGIENHYQDPFQATGLDPSIPWYAAIGNHDHFWMGVKVFNSKLQNAQIGSSILQLGNIFGNPNAMNENTYAMGTIDGSTPFGTIIGTGVVANMGTIPSVSADPNRHSLFRADWVSQFKTTSSKPIGHGLMPSDPNNVLGACYSFVPKSTVPLKIIVLDDTQEESEPAYAEGFYGHGQLTTERYNWLMAQLKAGQDANQLMIIAAHIPIGVVPVGNAMDWKPVPPGYASEKDLVAQLQSFPNLILWVAGHRHLNNVKAFPSTDPAHPENSFWEVETKSLREFPEQFRTFDIVCNSDNTISILATDVDTETKAGSQAEIGHSYAIASNQIYGLPATALETGSVSYNAELIKKLSPLMTEKLKNY